MKIPSWSQMTVMEKECKSRGFAAICGVDEAGAGPLAGPVYAAAVILDPLHPIEGLYDSKRLSEKRREALFPLIQTQAAAWAIAAVDAHEIDKINILQARLKAMRLAVEALSLTPDLALVDGNRDPCFAMETLLVTGGDGKSASIAAASILAKVARDQYMTEAAVQYPRWQFERHKGYGTKLHRELILKHGCCPLHRKSFLTKLIPEEESL